MNRPLLITGFLLVLVPHALGQQPNMDELKGNAQKVVHILAADKDKAQTYCEIRALGEHIDQIAREKGKQEVENLVEKINDLEKRLGPEYLGLIEALSDADPNSKPVQDILSMFDRLDEESCKH